MSHLVGNPEDRFSRVQAHIGVKVHVPTNKGCLEIILQVLHTDPTLEIANEKVKNFNIK